MTSCLYTALTNQIEWNVHKCPNVLIRSFRDVFVSLSGFEISQLGGLLVIQTWQPTTNSMVGYYDHVENEREEKSVKFLNWARPICEELVKRGWWSDLIDPPRTLR
eukprot:TRINITY_DN3933_c0_g1_i10.p1 TRINITY_DN3933_c0_g1~~TRINITY_DN3933_c0_g1_i10.p1  ORF type:complete len:106 (+),score=19.42 TRINITY_DN3933_c0_g1_i10:818-1135(+)